MNAKTTPTIILPTRNRRDILERSIEDVFSQRHRDLHLIVINHNSTDTTDEFVRGIRDPRLTYVHHVGYQDAAWSPKNEGLRQLPDDSLGVLFRDDDDRYSSEDSIGYLVDAARTMDDRFGICTGDYLEFDEQGSLLRRTRGNVLTTQALADQAWFPVKASIFDIDLVKEVGILPPIRSRETILFAYFILNMIEQGYTGKEVTYIDKPITDKTRHHGEISVDNIANGSREAAEVLIRNVHRILHPEYIDPTT